MSMHHLLNPDDRIVVIDVCLVRPHWEEPSGTWRTMKVFLCWIGLVVTLVPSMAHTEATARVHLQGQHLFYGKDPRHSRIV
jgi:hypothetical protein